MVAFVARSKHAESCDTTTRNCDAPPELDHTFRHEVRYASAHDPRHKLHDGTVSAIWGERGRSEILPVVVVKDPLTWMDSMCRVSYKAHGEV